jgi:hypothetical protein
MNSKSLHRQINVEAKQAGFMPTYWSCETISLVNDRLGSSGSGGTVV